MIYAIRIMTKKPNVKISVFSTKTNAKREYGQAIQTALRRDAKS
jgi:hypothetical protein